MNYMAKVTVVAGVCGFVTKIEALLDDSQKVKLSIESDCPHVMDLAEEYPESEGMMEVFLPFGEAPLFKAAKKTLKHSTCPVPSAIMKGIEVTCGLALPRDVTIQVER
jgi:hypothetical protein